MDIVLESNKVVEKILLTPELKDFVDGNLPLPKVYKGKADIKLIVLGQDPTVKNAVSRKNIQTVLNLDKAGALRSYLTDVCSKLNLTLDHVYATNLLKNFFIAPPTTITEINIFKQFLPVWLPILKIELSQYPNVPVISLGEPLLEVIVKEGVKRKVREYWNYDNDASYSFLKSEDNILNRDVFPFPHQPSTRFNFYKENMSSYIQFLLKSINVQG